MREPGAFGTELRRRRLAAGLSLSAFADLVHYSKSHLSKVETGAKTPGPELARLCDAALHADGALAVLVPAETEAGTEIPAPPGAELWSMHMAATGGGEFLVVPRRDFLGMGTATMATWALHPAAGTQLDGRRVTAAFHAMFQELRSLGQATPPVALLPVLVAQTHALRALAGTTASRDRGAVLMLAARFAEYTGWMSQEAGDDRAALWWTDRATEFAAQAGDRDLGPYALVRRALIALYQRDSRNTVGPAVRAQSADCTVRVRGLAAQREAQGWALAGDYSGCMRALDRAGKLLGTVPAGLPSVGSWTVRDPVALATGWCLYDLGYPARAVAVLDRELATIPVQALRARARYGARLALAYAACDEIEQACTVAGPVLDAMASVDSETIRIELRDLSRALSRRRTHAAVRELTPRLTAALTR